MINQHEFKIEKNEDIEKCKNDFAKVDHIHLDLKNSTLDDNKFEELCSTLKERSNLKIFQLDISDLEMNDKKIDNFVNCFKNWNLRHFHINISNIKFTDDQFKKFFEPLLNMSNLQKLHLIMENVNMNDCKRKFIEDLIEKCNNLTDVSLNIKNNNLSLEQMDRLRKLIDPVPTRELLWY